MTDIKIWANEEFYEDGTTPTKVAVSDALAAKGHRPNTANCSAEEENYLLNQLTTDVNALIIKTNNNGYSILQIANTPESNPINQTVTATGSTPLALDHSAFATANPLAVDDVIDVSYGPIDFQNQNTTGNNAFLCLQASQNGGAFATIRSYLLLINRSYPLTIRAQFKCTTAGTFIMQLAVLNDNAGAGVSCRSLEDGNLTLFDYTVMRVMPAIT